MNDAFALTPIGRQLARMPLDPRIGRMLIAAREQQCMREMLIIASGLSVPDPRAGMQGTKESQREAANSEPYRMSALRDCVEQLAPKSRQIVAGRYSDGWKAPDLADHLGMTPGAVRQALMRIREQLEQCIELQMAEG